MSKKSPRRLHYLHRRLYKSRHSQKSPQHHHSHFVQQTRNHRQRSKLMRLPSTHSSLMTSRLKRNKSRCQRSRNGSDQKLRKKRRTPSSPTSHSMKQWSRRRRTRSSLSFPLTKQWSRKRQTPSSLASPSMKQWRRIKKVITLLSQSKRSMKRKRTMMRTWSHQRILRAFPKYAEGSLARRSKKTLRGTPTRDCLLLLKPTIILKTTPIRASRNYLKSQSTWLNTMSVCRRRPITPWKINLGSKIHSARIPH